jgi:FtsZ-binding cell division protein ZapB
LQPFCSAHLLILILAYAEDTQTMSEYGSSDDEKEIGWQLASSSGRDSPRAGGSSSYLKTVVRQQQDATKTCRLLALEVGSLKAELAREQKKRAQAVHRATTAEATQQQAEQRLQELQYSNNKLQQEVDAAHKASEANSRRVNSLRSSLADAEAEAQDMKAKCQQQVRPPAGSTSHGMPNR